MLKGGMGGMGATESGSNASTSGHLEFEKLDFSATFDGFNMEPIWGCGKDDLGLPDDLPMLKTEVLRALFEEDSSDNGLLVSLEEEPRKRRRTTWPKQEQEAIRGFNTRGAAAREFPQGVQASGGGCKREDGRSSAANSGNGVPAQPCSMPAIGYPAGQMPALPMDVPGIVWGLPTTPLQIIPRHNVAHQGPAMPFTSTSYLGCTPGAVQQFSRMMPFPMPPVPKARNASLSDSRPLLGPMMIPPGTSGLKPLHESLKKASKSGTAAGNQSLQVPALAGGTALKHSSSSARMPFPMMMPFPVPSSVSGMGPPFPSTLDLRPMCGPGGFMMPAAKVIKPDVLLDLLEVGGSVGHRKAAQKPPLGLLLKKSASFADLINKCLQQSIGAS